MNTENKNNEMLYKSNPTVAALNKVPGFDPLKLLRRTKSAETDEPVWRLDLPYKKLWFRLANPKGRIRVNALRVTEQMAIYEAQIYLNSDDPQPVGSFTAQCTKDSVPDGRYIEAAQQKAVNEALTDAGYGIQFADMSMRPEDKRYGSEIPVTAVQTAQAAPVVQPAEKTAAPAMAQPTVKQSVPAKTVTAAAQPAPTAPPTAKAPAPAMVQPSPAAQPAAKQAVPAQTVTAAALPAPAAPPVVKAPVSASVQPTVAQPVSAQTATAQSEEKAKQPAPTKEPATVPAAAPATAPAPAASSLVQTAVALSPQPAAPTAKPDPTPVAPEVSAAAGEGKPSYTQETPVNDILREMTMDQAMDVVVDSGTCNGWTLREVSAKRPACLKFYIYSYKGRNNILRAAAKLIFDSLTAQAA